MLVWWRLRRGFTHVMALSLAILMLAWPVRDVLAAPAEAPTNEGAVAGPQWTTRSSGTRATLYGVASGSGRIVAVGTAGTLLSSSDGASWSAASAGMTETLFAVTYGSGLFVAVGDAGTVIRSADGGSSWQKSQSGTLALLQDAAYGNGHYVAVGSNGVIISSTDASTWTEHADDQKRQLYSVAFGNGTFVAVGEGGTVLTSRDGATWSRTASGAQSDLTGVAFGNGRFMVVGQAGTVLISTDGSGWSTKAQDPEKFAGAWRVAAGGSRFVGVGGLGSIVETTDGTAWSRTENDLGSFLQDVLYLNGQFIAVGEEGAIQTSGAGAITPNGKDSEPPKVAPQAPSPPAPPEAKPGCEAGVVSGPPVERAVRELKLKADGVKKLATGLEELCGTISLTEYVKVDGALRISSDSPNLEGTGRVYMQVSRPVSFSLMLFDGHFILNAETLKIRPQGALTEMMLAGLPIIVDEVALTPKGMEITTGQLLLPEDIMNLVELERIMSQPGTEPRQVSKMPIKKVQVSDGDLSGTFGPSGKVKIGAISIEKVEIEIDIANGNYKFGGTFDAKIVEFDAEAALHNWRIDTVGLGVKTKIALGTSGFFIVRLRGKVSGMQSPPLKISAGGDIGGGFPIGKDDWLINAANLEVEIEWKGSALDSVFTASGELALWKLTLSKSRVKIDRQWFEATSSVNLLDIIIAEGLFKVNSHELYGHLEGRVQIPRGQPFFPGLSLAHAEATVGKEGVRAAARVLFVRVGCHVTLALQLQRCGGNIGLLASTAYHPAYLASNAAQLVPQAQRFDIPADMKQALVQLAWADNAPDTDFVLIAPDGTRYTPENSPPTSDKVAYMVEPNLNFAVFALNAPQPGTWRFEVTNPALTSATLNVGQVDPAPTLMVTAPGADIAASGPVTVTWKTDAPAGSKVNLFYDSAEKGFRGTLIAKDLAASGTYQWDPSALPDGAYYVYASVDDQITAPVYAYGLGKITVRNPHTPAVPTGLTANAVDGKVALGWDAVKAPDLAGYFVYLLGEKQQRMFVEGGTQFAWAGLTPGANYRFGVSAVSLADLESAISAPVAVTLAAPKPPALTVNWPATPAVNKAGMHISGQVSAGGSAALFQNGRPVARGLTGTFDAPVTLVAGENQLALVAVAANGDSVEARRVYVLDEVRPELVVDELRSGAVVSQENLVVTGKVEPGANLTAGGSPVTVQPDGSYRTVIKLQTGENQVEMVARDVAGNEKRFRGAVTLSASAAPACGRVFPDVTARDAACAAIEMLAARKVLSGYPDGTFQPDRGISRAEFAKMLVVALDRPLQPNGALPFSDAGTHWAAMNGYLQTAVAMKVIGGFPDATFRPDEPVTRAQVVRIAAAAAGLTPSGTPAYTDVSETDWFAGWVAAGARARLIGASSPNTVWASATFGGDRAASRAEAAMVLANLLGIK